MKTCSKCGVEKTRTEFRTNDTRKDGLYCYCRKCEAKISSAYNKAHPEKKLLRQYGITKVQFDTMFEQQGGLCKICRQPEVGRRLAVDHCHVTNKVRGLLCSNCNTTLGKFQDDPARLRAAANYLETAHVES